MDIDRKVRRIWKTMGRMIEKLGRAGLRWRLGQKGWSTGEIITYRPIYLSSTTEKGTGTGLRSIMGNTREEDTKKLRGRMREKEGEVKRFWEGEQKTKKS